MAQFYFEPQELLQLLEEARSIHQEALVQRHGYSKYEESIDFFEMHFCSDYLTIQQFNRIQYKYLREESEQATPESMIKVLRVVIDRQENLSASN